MRHIGVVRTLAVSLIFGITGCEKIPTWGELTGGQQPAAAPPPTTVPAVQAPPPVQVAPPAGPSPEEVIAKFKAMRPGDISDGSITALTNLNEGLDQVTEINADGSGVTKNAFGAIEKLTNLRQLRLASTKIDNEACQKIAQVTSLEVLVLNSTQVNDVGVAALSGLQNLKHLELNNCLLTPNGFAAIGQFPSLEFIAIEHTNMTNETLDLVCNAKTLKQFYMSNNSINDYGLAALKKLTALEILAINHTQVTGEGLGFAQKGGGLKSLTTLGMYTCPMSANGAKAISQFKSLERLNIGGIGLLNDEALAYMISGMKKLKYLNLSKCTSLSGQGLIGLKGNKEIEELHFDQCPGIGDAVIPFLKTLKSLKTVSLNSTAITPNGASQLRAALPDAKVY